MDPEATYLGHRELSPNITTVEKEGLGSTGSPVFRKLFKTYLKKIGETRKLSAIPASETPEIVTSFFLFFRKTKHVQRPSQKCFCSYLNSLEALIKSENLIHVPHDWEAYVIGLRRTLMSKNSRCWKQRNEEGTPGTLPGVEVLLTDANIDRLWENQHFGIHSPFTIIKTLWMYIIVYFGLNNLKTHLSLKWGDVKLRKAEGSEFLEYRHRRPTAANRSRERLWATPLCPERCPVLLYKEYRCNRPLSCLEQDAPFYLAPHSNRTNSSGQKLRFEHEAIQGKKLFTMVEAMLLTLG